MGYHTYYTIYVEPEEKRQEVVSSLRETNQLIRNVLDDCGYFLCDLVWSDYDKDVLAVSKKHPDVFITIYGEGDDSEDLWVHYFQNGKSQYCQAQITYEPYDPEMME
jgi:hypothetical protein